MSDHAKLPRVALACLSTLFLVVLVRTAWIGDDALISFRTVLNVTHGYGLTFNITERVQTFTHPLWLLMLTAVYLVIGNIYYTAFALGIGLSLVAFRILVREASSIRQACLVAGVLLFSHAFVDYSTSGLENALLFVLLLWSVRVFGREDLSEGARLTRLWLGVALVYLTRPDAVLLLAPLAIVAVLCAARLRAAWRPVLMGLSPAIAWTGFALVYYGFPFPNTAYAKLGTGISRGELWSQGVVYLLDSLDRDPVTLVAIFIAVAASWWGRVDLRLRAVAVGIALYVGYVVHIGGDFMAGRFLAAPFVLAMFVLGRAVLESTIEWVAVAGVLAVSAVAGTGWPITSDSRYAAGETKLSGLVDERAMFFRTHGLIRATRRSFVEPEWPENDGRPGRPYVQPTCGLLGAGGIDMGPHAHLLDECALADPLLARLPSVWNADWRAGHFRRMTPDKYPESLEARSNLLTDRDLHDYYEQLRLATRSRRWFSGDRWRAIMRLNFGLDDHLINRSYYRYQGELASLEDLADAKVDGTDPGAPGVRHAREGLAVTLDDQVNRRYLDMAIDSADRMRVTFIKDNVALSTLEVGPVPEYRRRPGLSGYTLDVPPRARREGFDTIFIEPAGGDPPYPIGHLLIEGFEPTDAELYRRVAARDDEAPPAR